MLFRVMTDPIDAPRPVAGERRQTARRHSDPAPPPLVDGERANFPVLTDAPKERNDPEPDHGGGPEVFAAQVMGQDGQKRGLRGGPPVLNQARAAYLGAEYSGRRDRRPPVGKTTKTEA
jgi:hypothetical protein